MQTFKSFIFLLSRIYTVLAGAFFLYITLAVSIPEYLEPGMRSSLDTRVGFTIFLFVLFGIMLIMPSQELAKGGLFHFSFAVFITGIVYFLFISLAVHSKMASGIIGGAVILFAEVLPLFVALLQLIFERRKQQKPEYHDVIQRR